MDVMKHPADGGHNKHLKPGVASHDKHHVLPMQPLPQPDAGMGMAPGQM